MSALLALSLAALLPLLAAAQSPADFDQVREAAEAARANGDITRAVSLYTQAEQMNPQWPDGWWFIGTMQYGANQFEPARDALGRYLALNPKAGPAFALRGLCEYETGQYPEALQDLSVGIELGAANQPRNAQIIFFHQAMLLTRLGHFDEAISKYPLLVKEGAGSQELALAVGLAGLRMPLLPQEVDRAQSALVSLVGRAGIAVMNKNMAAGRNAFQAVFERYPNTPNVHYLYGYLLFATQPDDAIAQFQEELAISPRNASAHAMRAWAVGLQGDYAAAMGDAQKAVAEDASLPMAQLVYGRALVETGDPNAGISHLEKVLQTEPGNLEAHLTLAKAYSKLGRSDDARRERLLCLSLTDPHAQQGTPSSATP